MATYRITAPDGGTYEVTAPDSASEADVLAYAQKNYAQPTATPSAPTKPKTFTQSLGDLLAGGVRGAGSIGATILAPVDMAKDAIDGKGLSLESNRQRRADMDSALGQLGADTNSTAFGIGKLGGEIAGTAGMGGVLAKPVQALAASRYGAGIEPLLEGGARALQTGGFRVGPLAGTSAAIPARIIGGAATGGATAGLVNPKDAGSGVIIGGTLPGATAVAGKVGEKIGAAFRGGSVTTPEKLATARAAMDAGYLIPPSQVNPSFGNRLLESLSGKFETAQLASTKNQDVTNSLARKALGLADDAPLSQEAMQAVRKQAGQVYEQLKGTGAVTADQTYLKALDGIGQNIKSATASFPQLGKGADEIGELVKALKQPQFDAGGAVDAIAVLRDKADAAFASNDKALGRASKAAAKALEDVLDRHLQTIGANDLLPAYRYARQLIAKSYTVEKALREGAGTVDARTLARELQKGKPLSGELLSAARFGNTFDKAAQPPHLIGSPGVNALKPMLSLATSGIGGAALGPGGLALGAVNYALPPAARSVMFSQPFQRGLLRQSLPMLDEAAPMGLLTQGAYRAAPLLSGQ